MKKIYIIFCLITFMLFTVNIASASDIPDSFCGYSWGTPPNEMPSKTFIALAGKLTPVYSLDNIQDLNLSQLLPPNVTPSEVRLLYSNKQFIEAQIKLDRKYAELVRDFLINTYGQPIKDEGPQYSGRYWIRYDWSSDSTRMSLFIHSEGFAKLTVTDEIWRKAQP